MAKKAKNILTKERAKEIREKARGMGEDELVDAFMMICRSAGRLYSGLVNDEPHQKRCEEVGIFADEMKKRLKAKSSKNSI
jgi:hypothetical protein